jgi:hypothetical protein
MSNRQRTSSHTFSRQKRFPVNESLHLKTEESPVSSPIRHIFKRCRHHTVRPDPCGTILWVTCFLLANSHSCLYSLHSSHSLFVTVLQVLPCSYPQASLSASPLCLRCRSFHLPWPSISSFVGYARGVIQSAKERILGL